MSARTFLNSRYTGYDGENIIFWSDWLKLCFSKFLIEGESFGGKRPLGNSGWENILMEELEEHNTSVDQVIEYLFLDKQYLSE